MLTILAAIFVFGVLVTVHEFGHFITAKLMGMRVDEFAIGFGPAIWRRRSGTTLYSLRAIPLGGYNRIAGMDPDDPPEPDSFKSKSIPARMFVILAGVLMNFLLPVLLFAGIFMTQGLEVPLDQPLLGHVVAQQAADRAGLRAGDRILTINSETVTSWQDIIDKLRRNGTQQVELTAERDGSVSTYTMIPVYNEELGRPLIGVSPRLERKTFSFFEAVPMGFKYTKLIIMSMFDGLLRIISGKQAAELAGPLGVARLAGEVAQQGFLPLINFVAFLSINLGVINLLPLPALDGGHFVLLVLEALRGKPLGSKAMYNIQAIGVALILAITIFSTFKDISR